MAHIGSSVGAPHLRTVSTGSMQAAGLQVVVAVVAAEPEFVVVAVVVVVASYPCQTFGVGLA